MREELYLLGVSPSVMKKLVKNHVYSIPDLLRTDPNVLALALKSQEGLVSDLVLRAKTVLTESVQMSQFQDERLSTGIGDLDELLGGGLVSGGLYEVVGGPGLDGTYTALRIGSAVALSEKPVFYCDTEGHFSLGLLHSIVNATVLSQFSYMRLTSHFQLAHFFTVFESLFQTPPALIILDSLSCLLKCIPFADSYDRTRKAVEMGLQLQELANRTGTVVLVTNKYTLSGGEMTPLLGESWSQLLLTRVQAERTHDGLMLRVSTALGHTAGGETIINNSSSY